MLLEESAITAHAWYVCDVPNEMNLILQKETYLIFHTVIVFNISLGSSALSSVSIQDEYSAVLWTAGSLIKYAKQDIYW